MRRRLGNKGVAAVFAAIFLPLLIGLSSLMIDVGLAFHVKSRLEYVATSASKIGASRLPDTNLAEEVANSLALSLLKQIRPQMRDATIAVEALSSGVTVTVTGRSKSFFSSIFGVSGISIRASSTHP